MNDKFVITVDVEGDNLWNFPSNVSCSNIRSLVKFHRLSTTFGFRPTYLVSYEVLQDPHSRSVMEEIVSTGGCEIGAHLHPWLTPPFSEEDSVRRYPSELREDEFSAKFETLHNKLKDTLGVFALSYRAGAWGFNLSNAKVLLDFGYKVDCSITPYVSWVNNPLGASPGADYRHCTPEPFFLTVNGKLLLEVPVSIILRREWPMHIDFLRTAFLTRKQKGLSSKFGRLLGLRPIWLRPFNTKALKNLITVHKRIHNKDIGVLEFMIHSSELMVGTSNRFRTEKDINQLFILIEHFFSYLCEQAVQGITLGEYRSLVDKSISQPPIRSHL